MRGSIITILVLAIVILCNRRIDERTPEGEERTGANIEYTVVCLEGRKFLSTRTYSNYQALAGPLGECDGN